MHLKTNELIPILFNKIIYHDHELFSSRIDCSLMVQKYILIKVCQLMTVKILQVIFSNMCFLYFQ